MCALTQSVRGSATCGMRGAKASMFAGLVAGLCGMLALVTMTRARCGARTDASGPVSR